VTCLASDKSGSFVGECSEHEAFLSIEAAEEFGQYIIDDPGFPAPTSAKD
jgi:hypothetical protein